MPEKYVPTVNVPFAMHLKYIDVWPNDLTKNAGKGYGSSLALRGEIDGADSRVYPKGFTDANIDAMANAGIIASDCTYDYDPVEKYSIPVVNGDITVTLSQPAGQKYPKMIFLRNGSRGPSQAAPAPVAGKRLPGEEDDGYFDALTNDEPAAVTTARAVLPPANGRSITASPKMQKVENEYEEALTFVLTNVCPKLEKQDIPVDGSAVNAMVATLLIQASRAA